MPLYGIDELGPAEPGEICFITEGEKAREALKAHGLTAVATVTGAHGCPNDEVFSPLVSLGYRLIRWPDADGQGQTHSQKIANAIARLRGKSVEFRWPGAIAESGDDAADYFERGGTVEQLREMINALPEESAPPWTEFDAADVESWDFPPVEFIIDGLLPEKGVVWVGGLPKASKTLLMLYLSLAIPSGRETAATRFPIRKRPKIYYVGREDPGARFKERITDILSTWPGARPQPGALRLVMKQAINLLDLTHVEHLRAQCVAGDYKVLVLDTWTALSPGADPMSAVDQAKLANSTPPGSTKAVARVCRKRPKLA